MELFCCPLCGRRSTYDPRLGSATCPECGFTPSMERRIVPESGKKPQARGQGPRSPSPPGIHRSLLDELLAHWSGSHRPGRARRLPTSGEAQSFFEQYRRVLGEGPRPQDGSTPGYVRCYMPDEKATQWFAAAYILLRQGERVKAAQHLHDLTRLYPIFPDPWIWLSATTDDPARRIDYLENAVLLEPAHPLARDALAIAQGRVSPEKARPRQGAGARAIDADCPRCGGSLQYEPGASQVECQHCGHLLQLQDTRLIDENARLIGDLQLHRRLQGHVWAAARRVTRCQACGAQLTMTHYLAKQCLFCGSTTVLVEDSSLTFEQPDGFLPFRLDRQEAVAAVAQTQRSASRRLRSWWTGQEEEVQRMQAVYLPFWVFDGFVEVRRPLAGGTGAGIRTGETLPGLDRVLLGSLADGAWMLSQRDRPASRGEPLLGKELLMFDNLIFSAMDFPPPWFLKQTLPFDLEALIPYEPHLLANWPAALYQRDVEAVAKKAYNQMLAKAVWRRKSQMLSSPADLIQLRRTFQVTTVTYQLVLLPLWVAVVQGEQDLKLVLVNGQTGQVAISSPLRSRSAES